MNLGKLPEKRISQSPFRSFCDHLIAFHNFLQYCFMKLTLRNIVIRNAGFSTVCHRDPISREKPMEIAEKTIQNGQKF